MVLDNKSMVIFITIIHENSKAIVSAIASVGFFVFGNICNVFYNGIDIEALRFFSYSISILSGILAISYTIYKFYKDLKKKQ